MYGISPEEYAEYEASLAPETPTSPPTRTRRSVSVPVAIGIAVVMALLGSTAALAGPGIFTDVPDDHPFAASISWMRSTGVSEGYSDGSYKPNAPVSRQAMSAFMQRLYDLQEDTGYATSPNVATFTSTNFVDIPGMSATVVVPDGVYANVVARYSAESRTAGPVNQWATVKLVISRSGGPFTELQPVVGANAAFDSTGSTAASDNWESHGIERVAEVDGGTYTIKAQVAVQFGVSIDLDDMTLVAESDLQPSSYIPS